VSNTFTNFYPTRWQDVAFFEFAAAAIVPQVVNMTWADPGGPSESIRIPTFQFSTADIDTVANLIDTPDAASESTLLLNMDQARGFHFQVLYTEQDQANVALGESILRQRAAALAAVVDQQVFGIITGATTTLSGAINKATLVSAIELLNNNNAPQTDRILVVQPTAYSELLNTDDFVRSDSIAGSERNRTGLVGEVLGLEVFLSNNLPTAAGAGSVDAYVAHRSSLAMAMLRTVDIRVFDQPRHFSVGYTGRATWGQTLIDANLIVPLDNNAGA
jgi:hypothetical protein